MAMETFPLCFPQSKSPYIIHLGASFVLILFTFHIAQAQSPVVGQAGSPPSPLPQPTKPSPSLPLDCAAECGRRCSKTKRPNLCKRACTSCCGRCNCVPPGTSGNYDACPCYANLTIKNNIRKCP